MFTLFDSPGRFYRGNLHTHSTRSDGTRPPEEVIRAYRAGGYDFLCLSDHFMEQYDWPITDTRSFMDEKFVTLQGAELHMPETSQRELWHVLAVGLPPEFHAIRSDESGPGVARRAAAAGAFVGIVHPSCSALSIEDGRAIDIAHAVEIYNHLGAQSDRGDGWYLCNSLLNEGRRLSGFASDDCHYGTSDQFGGWIQVKARTLEPSAIVEALKAGEFYSSQGPTIHSVEMQGDVAEIICSPVSTAVAGGYGSKIAVQHGDELTRFRFPLEKFQKHYVRFTVVDRGGRRAWTNAFWFS